MRLVPEVRESRTFGTDSHGSFLLPDRNRGASPGIAGRDYAVLGKDEHGAGSLDLPEHVLDAFDEILSPDYQEADEFGDVDLAAAELREVHSFCQELLRQVFGIVDPGDSDQGETSEMGVDKHRLGIRITDDTDAGIAGEFPEFIFEPAPEIAVFKTVYPAQESLLGVVGG